MDQMLIYSGCGIALFSVGLYFLVLPCHILKKVLAINIVSVGVFMLLIANAKVSEQLIDPVPHAMVLTGIVVAVAATALALFFICEIAKANQQENRNND